MIVEKEQSVYLTYKNIFHFAQISIESHIHTIYHSFESQLSSILIGGFLSVNHWRISTMHYLKKLFLAHERVRV